MADGKRIRELLLLERDGKLSPEQVSDIGVLRNAGRFPPSLAGPPSVEAGPKHPWVATTEMARAGMTPTGEPINQALVRGGREALADVIRTGSGLVTAAPVLAPVAGAAGETAAQFVESGEITSPTSIGVAAAVPPAAAAAGRVLRGAGRTLTRMMPSRFRGAHEEAIRAAEEMVEGLRPNVPPRDLFQAARREGGEVLPVTRTTEVLRDLNQTIPQNAVSPPLRLVREHMANIDGAIQGGTIELGDLMRLRTDLSQSYGRAPQVRELYGGIIEDLRRAAAQGGPGAEMLTQALRAFQYDLGANRLGDLVTRATTRRAIAGADTPILNVSRFANDFARDAAEFNRLLGPEGVQQVGAFIQRFRSLPPEVAYNGWNLMVTGLFGGAGLVSGGAVPAVTAAIGQELMRNAAAVGRNPEALNRYMTTLVQAARAAAATPEP